MARAGQGNPAFSSVLKYYGAELNKRRHEILMSAGGIDALEWESDRSRGGARPRAWLRMLAMTAITVLSLAVVAMAIRTRYGIPVRIDAGPAGDGETGAVGNGGIDSPCDGRLARPDGVDEGAASQGQDQRFEFSLMAFSRTGQGGIEIVQDLPERRGAI